MEGRNKRVAILLAVFAAFAAAIAGTAGAHTGSKALSGTLNIYGYGPGDDVQENRANYAANQVNGVTINRPAGNFDDQVS
jgi:hypothetical protein